MKLSLFYELYVWMETYRLTGIEEEEAVSPLFLTWCKKDTPNLIHQGQHDNSKDSFC